MPKISVLMPTYNDSEYIIRAISSVCMQKYKDWELLICDDGSYDNTKDIVSSYIESNKLSDRVFYFYQENADQLNAIISLIPYIKGDYIYIFHSDDLIFDSDTFGKMINYMNDNSDVDSIISDIAIIDKNDNIVGMQRVSKYQNNKSTIALQQLWLGRNLYVDMAFHRKDIFLKSVYNNYLIWNGPFWLDIERYSMLNVRNVSFPFFKYRVFDDNYVNTAGANYNIINGELRVLINLMFFNYIPLYKIQFIIYRLFCRLGIRYRTIYFERDTKNKYSIIKFALRKRFSLAEINDNIYLNSILNFYKNNNHRRISVSVPDDIMIYMGKDMRIFNKRIDGNTLEDFYVDFMKNMEIGFDEIVVSSKDSSSIKDILRFFCIDRAVTIIEGDEK